VRENQSLIHLSEVLNIKGGGGIFAKVAKVQGVIEVSPILFYYF
jgi:hypothetical protein